MYNFSYKLWPSRRISIFNHVAYVIRRSLKRRCYRQIVAYVDQSSSNKQVTLSFDTYLLATMVFQKAISRLRNLASRKAKNASKKGDISTETQTPRGDMRRYNLMWMPKELRSNRLTPLNKDNLKNVLFKNPRKK